MNNLDKLVYFSMLLLAIAGVILYIHNQKEAFGQLCTQHCKALNGKVGYVDSYTCNCEVYNYTFPKLVVITALPPSK